MRAQIAISAMLLLCVSTGSLADDSPMTRHDKIDIISLSPDNKYIVLSLVETRPWLKGTDNVLDLQAKLKMYVNYVESGALVRSYPQAKDKPVRIRLASTYPLDGDAEHFIQLAKRQWLDPLQIEWETSAPSK